MKITLTTKYFIRSDVFMGQSNRVVNSSEIAQQTGVPKDYLIRILQKGVKAGIFTVHQGVLGGYELKRAPEEITL